LDLAKAIRKAKRTYLCGNGGSAANATHIANDLISVGVRAHSLTADVATLTAIANDYSYDDVFSRQLMVFAEAGDLLIALSGSGQSRNILEAIDEAHHIGMTVWPIFGHGMKMQRAEEHQLEIGHEAMLWLKANP
jgi:D-sedoheptulose 7-phosphate isomerase